MRIAVVGAGRTAATAVHALARSGGAEVASVITLPLIPSGRHGAGNATAPIGPGPNVELARDDVAAGDWLDGFDVCVLAADTVDRAFCFEVNAGCVAAATPLVPALGMGVVAQIGPWVISGMGPCLECIDIRVYNALGRQGLVGPYPPNPGLAEAVGHRVAGLALEDDEAARAALSYLWEDGREETHRALRSYRCGTCGGREPAPSYTRAGRVGLDGTAQPDPNRIRRLENLLVDPIMGVARWITDYPPPPDEPQIAHAVASVADRRWERHGKEIHAGGNDLDREQARASALGETLDRLGSSPPPPQQMRVARYMDLDEPAVEQRRFDMYHPLTRQADGFPYSPTDDATAMSWIWAWSLTERISKLVPASRVFLPMESHLPGDRPDIATLSGAATGSTPELAVLGGLLEVVERDTFMISWATRVPMTGIALDRHSPGDVGRYVAAFEDAGIEVRCSSVTLDWAIPLVVAIAKPTRPRQPSAVISAAAAFDLTTACRRALKELTANLAHVRHLMAEGFEIPDADPAAVRTQNAHALLYASPAVAPHLKAWEDPEAWISLPGSEPAGGPTTLDGLVAKAASRNLEVLTVDVSQPGLPERGLWTFKTIVPGTYPMNFDSLWPHFGGERMRSAPLQAGLLSEPVTFNDLNRVPHPFP